MVVYQEGCWKKEKNNKAICKTLSMILLLAVKKEEENAEKTV